MVTAGMNEGQDGASRLNILEVISRRYPELRKSDRKVADLVSADPGWVLRAKLAETASAAGVSEPTVMQALATLPVQQRAVVICRFYLGMNEAETATALHVRPGTVKSRLHRALAHLRTTLDHLAPEAFK